MQHPGPIRSLPARPAPMRRKPSEDGYMLLVAIFLLFLLALSLSVAAPRVAKSLQRDREVETMHRGKQYVRAIQLYYRKFHSYPSSIDQLVSTDNIRFLRKKYIDPMTGKDDWKLIHFGQNKTPLAMGFFGQAMGPGGGARLGPLGLGGSNGGTTGGGFGSSTGNGFGSSTGSGFGSSFGSSSGSSFGSTTGSSSVFGSSTNGSSTNGSSATGATGSTGDSSAKNAKDTTNCSVDESANGADANNNSNSGFGTGSGSSFGSGSGSSFGSGSGSSFGSGSGSGSSFGSGSGSSFGSSSGSSFGSDSGGTGSGTGLGTGFMSGQTFGGIIVGVSPASAKKSILVYKKKDCYNQWEFTFSPMMEMMQQSGGNAGIGQPANGMDGSGTSSGFGGTGSNSFGGSGSSPFGGSGNIRRRFQLWR